MYSVAVVSQGLVSITNVSILALCVNPLMNLVLVCKKPENANSTSVQICKKPENTNSAGVQPLFKSLRVQTNMQGGFINRSSSAWLSN